MKTLRAFFASMAGRMFLVLLLGVFVSAGLSLTVADAKRRADLERLHLERAADWAEDIVAQRERGGTLADGVGPRDLPADRVTAGPVDPAFTALLVQRFGAASGVEARHADVGNCLRAGDSRRRIRTPGPDEVRLGIQPPICWLVTLKLKSGAPARLLVGTPPRLVGEARSVDPLALAILGAGAAVMALVLARMSTAPLRDLSHAAGELGRDLDRAPMAEAGPTEVAEAARTFNAMQARLKRNLSDRTQMLAAITHDLQTPLTRIRLRLEKVGDEALRGKLLGDLAEMQALIRQGLDLARSAESIEPPARLDLDSLLESLVEDAIDAGAQARFVRGAGRDVLARPDALRRCVGNLMDNAAKYGGDVEVLSEPRGAGVAVRIRDRGPGVPEDQLETILEPFVRLEDSRSRDTGGAGLGLAIARALAEKNGARLSLRNHPEGGLEAELVFAVSA
ncbi:ATP-binding protein [Phenylobacterium aquaticum]|uniref:ATP-binding protein n=1 Tax=Phenylobacterium aquaticum TaxID=1763816 RepID=UPI001F5C68B6|nr:ATP-binding protein [Phenylobacterium aquaticum]